MSYSTNPVAQILDAPMNPAMDGVQVLSDISAHGARLLKIPACRWPKVLPVWVMP